MPFVKRDSDGNINAVFETESEAGLEEVAAEDPDLKEFVARQLVGGMEWVQSDLSLARVLEDLIDLLIDKNVILFTDFPEAAQGKLLQRHGLRKEFAYVEALFSPEDEDFGGAEEGPEGDGGDMEEEYRQ